jgi:phosphonate transport system substrate-binding protein
MKKVLVLLFIMIAPLVQAEQPALTFGIVPQQSASKLARLWSPIIQRLSQQTGLSIRFATAPNIPTFEQRLKEGRYDIAYMNPYHFTVFNASPGYRALAKARDKRIKGILVTGKDNPVQSLKELEGSTLAFPAPAAFAATLLTQAQLKSEKIAFTPKYVSSHDSVYRSVAKGLYPAGGGIIRTLNNIEPDVRAQLRVLWTSAGHTPHAIATHPDMDPTNREKLQKAITRLDDDPKGKALLDRIKIKGFEKASDKDWNDVRALNINAPAN